MDKRTFSLLSLQDQLIILQTQAEKLTTVPSRANEVTLYSYSGYLVEEYRNRESNELVKIEALAKENEQERLKVYSMYIDFANEAVNFKNRKANLVIVICLGCEYEWFPERDIKTNNICCPICENRKWTFLYEKTCKACNSVYYSGDGTFKRTCPNCK